MQARLVLRLAQAAGATGMVGGQALDIAAETAAAPLDLEQISALQALKTGALFGWAAESGAILGRSDPDAAAPLRGGARARLPDPRRHPRRRGRSGGGGQAAAARTRRAARRPSSSLLGLDGGAAEGARDLVADACDALAPYGSAAGNLRLAAQFALARSN